MTQQYDQTNSGALFNNTKKSHANQPDFNGKINVAGVEYWIAGWKKKDRNENTYVSLAVTEKEQQQAPARRQAPPAQRPAPSQGQRPAPRGNGFGGGFDDMDDSIPF